MNTYESLQIGDSFCIQRTITAEDVRFFADVTGDDNPLHVDAEYAAGTRFGGPIVHGVFLSSLISKVLGRDFPGPGSIAVSINCKFLRPVPVGSTVDVEVKVAEKIEKYGQIRMRVYVTLDGRIALGGEAVLIPPESQS